MNTNKWDEIEFSISFRMRLNIQSQNSLWVWGRTPIPLQSRTNGDIEEGGVDFQGMKVENVGADNTSTSSRHNHAGIP